MPRAHRLLPAALALAVACGGGASPTSPSSPASVTPSTPVTAPSTPTGPSTTARADTSWDVAARGVPALIEAHYIDLARVAAVSRFRSGVGHDYADDVERCRSMKHYFRPAGSDWAGVRVVAPVSGRVTRVLPEWAGTQLQIRSSAYPAFTVVLFHVALDRALAAGDSVTAGGALGTHVGTQTTSDVAVWAMLPGGRRGLVSYVEALPDALWSVLAARGVAARDSLVISRAARDAAPLACDGEAFTGTDPLPQWVTLK